MIETDVVWIEWKVFQEVMAEFWWALFIQIVWANLFHSVNMMEWNCLGNGPEMSGRHIL